jgi:hypothetical protein
LSYGQSKVDEFAFVLLAGVLLIAILLVTLGLPTEAPPFVTPAQITIDAPRGAASYFDLNVTGKLTNVTLNATGDVGRWLSFNKNGFDIIDYSFVKVKVNVPSTASGTHTASILVSSLGGSQNIPVTINVIERTTTALSRPIPLGDFTVSYFAGSDSVASKDNFEVSRGYLSSYPASMSGALTEEQMGRVESGYLNFVVDETNSAGALVVLLNGKEVYNKVTQAGAVSIPLNGSMILDSNTVEFNAMTPGWSFWMSTVYRFGSASLLVNYKGGASTNVPFDLNSNEISGFDHFRLTFRVRDYSSPLPPLQIKVNGELVSSSTPPFGFFERSFSTDVQGNKLFLDSNNSMSFTFESPGTISIDSAVMTVYYKETL